MEIRSNLIFKGFKIDKHVLLPISSINTKDLLETFNAELNYINSRLVILKFDYYLPSHGNRAWISSNRYVSTFKAGTGNPQWTK